MLPLLLRYMALQSFHLRLFVVEFQRLLFLRAQGISHDQGFPEREVILSASMWCTWESYPLENISKLREFDSLIKISGFCRKLRQ